MDGQFSLRKITLPIIALALLLPQTLFAQAMGKATLDPAGPAAPSPLQITLPTPFPAATTAPAPLPDAKTIAPLPSPPLAPATLPASPELKAETPIKPAAQKPIDSLPPDPVKASAPLRPIEAQEIRPRSPETPATPAAGNTSYLPSGITSAFQVAAALAVVIGLIFLGKALAKKFLPSAKINNAKGVIEVLARYPLAKNQSLVLVRIGSQIVTLNQGKDQSHSVLVINDPNEVAKILGQIEGKNPNSIQAGFNKLLANARMDLEDPANDPEQPDFESRSMQPENLDTQLEEMAAAKRQLMDLRQQVRSVRDSLPANAPRR